MHVVRPSMYVAMKFLKYKTGKSLRPNLNHILNITKNANKKFNALMRVQKYMTTDQKNLIFSSLIKFQFTLR